MRPEIFTAFYEIHTKHMYNMCEKKVEFSNVKNLLCVVAKGH